MSYALRNTLIMGVFLVIVLSVGIYVVFLYQASILEEKAQTEKEKRQELADLALSAAVYDSVYEDLAHMKRKWETQEKVIPTRETPALTVAYLNQILSASGASINYNFTFERSETGKEYDTSLYTLEGQGSFEDLYKFVWYLEHKRRLVKIESLRLQAAQVREKEGEPAKVILNFVMKLQTYSAPKATREGRVLADIAVAPSVPSNPFLPLIWDQVPVNVEGLLNVERASLVALTSNMAFVQDEAGGMRALKEGDKVYLGYLYRIVPGKNQAIFRLNKAGILDTVVLTLEEGEEGITPFISPEMPPEEEPVISSSIPEREPVMTPPISEKKPTVIPSLGPTECLGVEVTRGSSGTEITLNMRGHSEYRKLVLSDPDRIVIDIEPAILTWKQKKLDVHRGVIQGVRSSQFSDRPPVVRVVIDLQAKADHEIERRDDNIVIIIK